MITLEEYKGYLEEHNRLHEMTVVFQRDIAELKSRSTSPEYIEGLEATSSRFLFDVGLRGTFLIGQIGAYLDQWVHSDEGRQVASKASEVIDDGGFTQGQ